MLNRVLKTSRSVWNGGRRSVHASADCDETFVSSLAQACSTATIGSGCSGTIHSLGESGVVFKVANSSNRYEDSILRLKHEELLLRTASKCAQGTSIQVPRSYGFFKTSELAFAQGRPFIAMQRVPLLPVDTENQLRSFYHPGRWEAKQAKLWRLYMGLDSVPEVGEFFGGTDYYPLLCSQAEIIGLPLKSIVRDMGKFIARMTYGEGWIPNDVEFVVGGPGAQVYCIDFGMVSKRSEQFEEIVEGLYGSDPYYPQRPDRYRDDFAEAYVCEARLLGEAEVATRVMDELHSRWYVDRCRLKIS